MTDRQATFRACHDAATPVDSFDPPMHGVGVSKKPRKVEEGAGAYAAKKQKKPAGIASHAKPPPSTIRYASSPQVRKAADEVFKVHADLFRKLAQ